MKWKGGLKPGLSLADWCSASIVTQTHWVFLIFPQSKATFCELLFLFGNVLLWQWNLPVFVCPAVCQCKCFITRLSPAGPGPSAAWPLLSPFSPLLVSSDPVLHQHRGYAEVLNAPFYFFKGRTNLLIYFAVFWTVVCLFSVNEIQSLCNSRDFRSPAILQ